MTDIFKPEDEAQVLEAIQWALSGNDKALEIIGHGSKRGLGPEVSADAVMDLSMLSGIELYEPEELVMTAKAGTSVDEVQAALDEAKQMLAFEPWQARSLYGGGSGGGTIGGLFAAAVAGPRRPMVGSARDHMLGFHAISGRGEMFKSGGRVVKNVTGFDLSKLMAGSMGTLAVMTEVSFKVLPQPQKTYTVMVFGASDPNKAMRAAQNCPYEVSAVAHLPAKIAARSDISYVKQAGRSVTAVRVEGPGPSVEVRCRVLRDLLGPYGDVEELHTTNSLALWREIRDVAYFEGDKTLWRLSVTPSEGGDIASSLGGEYILDWAGGLIWLALEPGDDAEAERVRGAFTEGHATLMRAPAEVRSHVPVFHPQAEGLQALNERVRAGFDPHGILNPGRI